MRWSQRRCAESPPAFVALVEARARSEQSARGASSSGGGGSKRGWGESAWEARTQIVESIECGQCDKVSNDLIARSARDESGDLLEIHVFELSFCIVDQRGAFLEPPQYTAPCICIVKYISVPSHDNNNTAPCIRIVEYISVPSGVVSKELVL